MVQIIWSSSLSYFPITDWDVNTIAILWALFAASLVFVLLRLYSRIKILHFYVLEDHLYNASFTLLLAYNVMITFYSFHGLGSAFPPSITTSDALLGVLLENLLFDAATVGLVVAKASLAAFLLRLVPPHRSVWLGRALCAAPLAALAVVDLAAVAAMWARCGHFLSGAMDQGCESVALAMRLMQAAAGVSVAVDFWYAALPWVMLRRLNRPWREKLMIQFSMSLGVIAGGCGIARCITIYPALVMSMPESTIILYLWHGAELAITMMCIAIPVCRPAYASIYRGLRQATGRRRRRGKTVSGTTAYGETYRETFGETDGWSSRRVRATRDLYDLGLMGSKPPGITVTKTVDVGP